MRRFELELENARFRGWLEGYEAGKRVGAWAGACLTLVALLAFTLARDAALRLLAQ